jgi:hypothetical protein
MYTNIDTPHALESISRWLQKSRIPASVAVNVPALIDALTLIMTNNYFRFGDTIWHQLTGTAMGTPPAPMYATLYFYVHEQVLIKKFKRRLPFYCRYIDDGFGIWSPSSCEHTDDTEWEVFQSEFDRFGSLRWEFSQRSDTTTFLDVTISLLPNNTIQTCLYEKALNLYLFLPSHSAHPPGVLKGLIFGMFVRIQRLTSDPSLRLEQCRKLFYRLRSRGYTSEVLQPLFNSAVTYLTPVQTSPSAGKKRTTSTTKTSPIFLHVPYHPRDPASTQLQRLFRDTLFVPANEPPLGRLRNRDGARVPVSRLIVAYHRPRNLGNLLSPRRLDTFGIAVSSFIEPDEIRDASNPNPYIKK